MLKKIPVDQLQPGMHLHELCGPWLDHPFWRTKFVLRDTHDLARLRASGVAECWIDSSKGRDAVANEPVQHEPAPAARALPVAPAPAPSVRSSIEDEAQYAAALCAKSKRAVQALFGEARLGRTIDTSGCVELVDEITSSVSRNPGAVVSLARLKTHDDYTYMHSVSVCALMVSLARQLGHNEAEVRNAGMAGLLHDMGKAMVPLDVLNKPGKLTDAEFEIIRAHPERGVELLRDGDAVGAVTHDVCLHHHERPDGKGYPERLSGDALSLHSRMGAVCDVYDAITSKRPYKHSWDPAESIARMAMWTQAGQFDPGVFQSFVRCIGIYPIGALVRLHSGRLAVVIDQNALALTSPRVRVFFSTRSQMPVPLEVLDLAQAGCHDRIVNRESNSQWQFPHLEELVVGADLVRKPR